MGYFDLKKQIQSSPKTSSKSSYFALKQKALPIIESNMLRRQEEEKRKRYEEAVRNAEIAKQQATKAGGFMGLAKETAKGVGKTLLDFGKEAVRFPLTVPLKVVQSLTEGFTGKPQIYTPETKVEKFVYGAEPRQSYQQDQSSIAKFAQEKGLGKGASVALGTAGAAAETIADLALPGVASKVFKSAVGKSILSRLGIKSAKLEEAVLKGTTTEKEIVDIFENKGIKGVEEIVSDRRVLEAGEVPKVVKEIESKSGRKLNVKEILQVNDDLKKGIRKETIIDELAPEASKMPVEPVKPKVEVKTPVKEKVDTDPLIQEAKKYKSAEEFVKAQQPVYHGTPEKFDNFSLEQVGKSTDSGMFGKGIYFTDDLKEATTYSKRGNKVGEVKEVILDLKKPYIIKTKADIPKIDVPNETIEQMRVADKEYSRLFTEKLQKEGYDGVIDMMSPGSKQYVVFNPSQIKTKSQLTDIWNKSQPLQEARKGNDELTWARGTRAAGIQNAGAKNYNQATKVLEKAGELPSEIKTPTVTKDFIKNYYETKKPPVIGDTFINARGEKIEITKVGDKQVDYFLKGKKKGIAGTIYSDNGFKMGENILVNVPPKATTKVATKGGGSIPQISQPLQEGVRPKVEVPKVELTPSKVAKSVEAKAVEEKLTKGFGDIAGYEKITIKEQAEKTANLLNDDFDNAIKMVKGEIPVKEGIKPEMLIKTVEDYAQAKGDVNLLRELAKSPLVSETSAHAQALRILAERNPESALANIQKVAKERAINFERKAGKTVDKATKEITDEIKTKVKQKIPTKQDWTKFIEEIKC